MKGMTTMLVAIAVGALSAPAAAQQAQQPARGSDVPAAYRPPAGMCRIWIDGVPAAQQPAPTDCPTAVRNRPEHGRVIFGDDYAGAARPAPFAPARSLTDTVRRPPVITPPSLRPTPTRQRTPGGG